MLTAMGDGEDDHQNAAGQPRKEPRPIERLHPELAALCQLGNLLVVMGPGDRAPFETGRGIADGFMTAAKPSSSSQAFLRLTDAVEKVGNERSRGRSKVSNPRGRPKEGKDKFPAFNEERMKSIPIEVTYRAIKFRDGTREVTITVIRAVVRSMALAAVKGQARSQRMFTALLQATEKKTSLNDERRSASSAWILSRIQTTSLST
jgi:hypothetical protein